MIRRSAAVPLSLAITLALLFTTSIATAATAPTLPPGEEDAKARLESSPRHGEYVDIPYNDTTKLRTWIVYPERKDKAGVVLLIHEIFGLSDWLRGVADQLAADGFIAVAPDLISGLGPGGGGTESVTSRDSVVALVRLLTPDESAARLAAVRKWIATIPAANGKVATMGFCWGGGRSFAAAATSPALNAAVVYYGVSPDSLTLPNVAVPVQGHYGGDDARVNATIEPAKQALARLKKSRYEAFVYDGAGHGFLRQQTGPNSRDGANLKATQAAWPRTLVFLRKNLK